MFLVFNKQKIYTYLVSVITVILLFCIANTIFIKNDSIETSANAQKLLPVYNVETQKNKVSLTMNCAW